MVLELLLPYLLAFNRCKDSANRVKNQIYLSFSEMQPIFGGVIPPKIRLFPRISKDIRDLTFVESLSRLGRPQTSLGLLSLLGDFYPFAVSQGSTESPDPHTLFICLVDYLTVFKSRYSVTASKPRHAWRGSWR